MIYENQDEVGRGLKKVIPSVVKREELFITSKLWNHSHQPDQVEKELDETLKLLGLEYIDLYCAFHVIYCIACITRCIHRSTSVIHWPVAFVPGNHFYPPSSTVPGEVELDTQTSLIDTWRAMIKLPKTKVCLNVTKISRKILNTVLGPCSWCIQL